MQSIKVWISDRLANDSEIKTLTGVTDAPYNVFHDDPKLNVDFSTNHALFIREDTSLPFAQDPDEMRTILYMITAKGPLLSTVEALLERCNELLHDLNKEDITDSPRKILTILFDWSGPDLYDDQKETRMKQQRYKVEAQIPRAR